MAEPDVARLERLSIGALPDLEHAMLDGWRLRFAAGVTNRANSLTAVAPGAAPIERVFDAARAAYRARGLRFAVRVTPLAPAGTEAALIARGFVERDAALCLIGDPAAFAAADAQVRLEPGSDPVWRAAYARAAGRFDAGEQAILARIHDAIAAPKAFARIEIDGAVAAHGYGVVEDGAVSIHEIGVAPEQRRRGLARRITRALAAFGAARGADLAWLHVRPGNAPALALYRELGFREVYAARYLVEPE